MRCFYTLCCCRNNIVRHYQRFVSWSYSCCTYDRASKLNMPTYNFLGQPKMLTAAAQLCCCTRLRVRHIGIYYCSSVYIVLLLLLLICQSHAEVHCRHLYTAFAMKVSNNKKSLLQLATLLAFWNSYRVFACCHTARIPNFINSQFFSHPNLANFRAKYFAAFRICEIFFNTSFANVRMAHEHWGEAVGSKGSARNMRYKWSA